MYENVKIGIMGGDLRQASIARRLSSLGFEIAVWGVPCDADIGAASRAADWRGAVNKSNAVILPLPASFDGANLNVLPGCGGEVSIECLFNSISADTLVVGGKFDNRIKALAKENNIKAMDYLECEELQIKNAIPTAEGALGIAIRDMPITVFGADMLVTGYGRIGKILSSLLKNAGARVTVVARRGDDLAYADAAGMNAVNYGTKAFFEAVFSADAVFNTVPAMIFDKALINKLERCSLIVDLASGAGGVDFDEAKKCGIKTVHALALPGKVAPVTAGIIICECILDILLREGVITKK